MNARPTQTVAEITALLAAASGPSLDKLIAEFESDTRAGVIAAVGVAKRREALWRAESRRLAALYRLEGDLRKRGYLVIAGIDEVGRGALAGPLTAGACVLPARPKIRGIDDSKRLTPARRRELSITIREVALCSAVAHLSAEELDSVGMASALKRVMGRALAMLELEPDHVVVDGRPVGLTREETAVVKGDSSVAAIAAASILAKVARDDLMSQLALTHPDYGFDVNKGYGTPEHLDAIAKHGMCAYHRRSFMPGGGTATLF